MQVQVCNVTDSLCMAAESEHLCLHVAFHWVPCGVSLDPTHTTIECGESTIKETKHTTTLLVVMWTLGHIITISFCLNVHSIHIYIQHTAQFYIFKAC